MVKRVAVLMSTYNGEMYLADQLDSLLSQRGGVEIDIFIRDDGSSDRTVEVINSYKSRFSSIHLDEGINLGVVRSFLRLVEDTTGYDYYALCDQDDVWDEIKVMVAVSALVEREGEIGEDKAALYCGGYKYVDEQLNPIGKFESHSPLSIDNLLIENCAPGCTMVFNEALRCLITKKLHLVQYSKIVMHDWYILIVAAVLGSVVYDPNPHILYRQHANNVVGVNNNWLARFFRRAKRFINSSEREKLVAQAETVLEAYREDMSGQSLDVFEELLAVRKDFWSRLVRMKDMRLRRVRVFDNFIFRCFYLFGVYR